jgi:hypothetical protein
MTAKHCLAIAASGPSVLAATVAFDGLTFPERQTWLVIAGYSLALILMIAGMALMLLSIQSEPESAKPPNPAVLVIGFAVFPIVYFARKAIRGEVVRIAWPASPRNWVLRSIAILLLVVGGALALTGTESARGLVPAAFGALGVALWLLAPRMSGGRAPR